MYQSGNPFTRLPIFYGWIVVTIAFITMAISVNSRVAFSLLFPAILDEFQWDRSLIAGAFSTGFIISGLFTPILGILMDRWGPRMVIPTGTTLVIAGYLGATTASTPLGIYVTLGIFVITGSIATSYFSHSMFLPNWFVRKRGLAVGIAFSGAGIGSITLLPWFQHIIDNDGWRQACFIIAGLLTLIIPLSIYFQRKRPEDLGLQPDGDGSTTSNHGNPSSNAIVDQDWFSRDWTLGMAMKTMRFWWLFAAIFSALFVWYAVLVHQTVYLVETSFDSTVAATALGLVGLFGVAGQIGIGLLSDRIGREWGWTIALCGFAACYTVLIVLAIIPSNIMLYLMVGLQGLLGYGLASLIGPIHAEIFPGRRFATIFAATGFGGTAGAGAGPWITGYIFDLTGSYQLAFWICVGMSIASIFCIWMAAPRKVMLVSGQSRKL